MLGQQISEATEATEATEAIDADAASAVNWVNRRRCWQWVVGDLRLGRE